MYLKVRDLGTGKWGTIVEETDEAEAGSFRVSECTRTQSSADVFSILGALLL